MSAWGRLVLVSAVAVGTCAAAVAVAWAATRDTRVAASVVRGELEGVVLDAGDGAVEVVGGGDQATLGVRRRDRSAFGHRPEIRRELRDGVVHLTGRCPSGVLTGCSASWRLVVPDNVPVHVMSEEGDVTLRGFRGSARITTDGGDIDITSFCGFALEARSESGGVRAAVTCAPERLSLRSRTGDVGVTVPAGRYEVDADSDTGSSSVRGVTTADDAPFQLQALSGTGDVRVEGRR